MGNVNNVNESRHIGEQGYWTPDLQPKSMLTTRSAATDLSYESKSKNVKNDFTADYTSSNDDMERHVNTENYFGDTYNTSTTRATSANGDRKLNIHNNLVLLKPYYNSYTTTFEY